jgi:hypothetical protein
MVAGGAVVPGTAVGAGVAGGAGWVQPERQSMTATTDSTAVKRSLFMDEHHGRSYMNIVQDPASFPDVDPHLRHPT